MGAIVKSLTPARLPLLACLGYLLAAVALGGLTFGLRGSLLDIQRGLLAALAEHLGPSVVPEPRARRDQPADDDVLLEAAQVVLLAADGGLRQHPGGLLERRRRDEAVGRERSLRDPEEHGRGRRPGLCGRCGLV